MSNFDFLNNKKFLAHPSCAVLYEYASSAEAVYSDHEKCALKVRFVLEQFCIFVSELKSASYPEKISMLGQYWSRKNEIEFLKTFGHENAGHIKHANTISRSFLHSKEISREDIYPEMLKSVYILLLWLYKELGFLTPLKYSDYSIKKIPADALSVPEPTGNIYYSSEEQLKNLKNLFPNCNTDQLYRVTQLKDRYVITDISGRQTESLIQAEKYQDSEKERMLLKEQLEQAGKQFEAAKKDFLENQTKQEALILELKGDRALMVETYEGALQELGNRYNLLQEKYEALIPLKEKKSQMQQQIVSLIKEREEQEKAFSDTHEALLGEIADLKRRLTSAQQDLVSMGTSAKESQQLIQRLENGLAEKEKELSAARSLAKKKLDALQTETLDVIQKYKDKANSLEIILTQIMAENTRFREMAMDRHPAEEARNYLLLVNQGISEIEEGYALYRQNPSEQLLREYLWKVKAHYDSRIENLEKALKEKEEKLAKERQRNNALFEALWEETARSQAYKSPQESDRKTEGDHSSFGIRAERGRRHKKKGRNRWLTVFSASLLTLITLVSLLLYWNDLSDRRMEDSQKSNEPRSAQKDTTRPRQSGNEQEAELPRTTAAPQDTDLPQATAEPQDTVAPNATDTPQDTIAPSATDTPQETQMPEETGAPDKTSQPFDEQTPEDAEFPTPSGESAGNGSGTQKRHADQVLAQAQENLDWLLSLPTSVAEIPGVSQDLLDDMEMIRGIFWDFQKVAGERYGEATEEYQPLGSYWMFGIVRTIYQLDSLKAGKFVYCADSMTSPYGFYLAVEPDAVISGISYDTPLAEIESVLGEADVRIEGLPSTDFSENLTDGKYVTAIFRFYTDDDSKDSSLPIQRILFLYNEEKDQMLDYVYVYQRMKR